MKKTTKTILEFDDYIITYDQNNYSFNSWDAKFEFKSTKSVSTIHHKHLENGELFYNLKMFDGYLFLDKNDILFDTIHRRVYVYKENYCFEGDENKEAFFLFENQNLIENKIKEGKKKMDENSDEKTKNKIEEEIIEELEEEFKNYDFKKFKFKNGKYSNGFREENCYVYYIKDNKLEIYRPWHDKKNYYNNDNINLYFMERE